MNARKDRQKPLKSTHHKDSLDSDVPESQVDRRKENIYLAGIFIVVLTLWAGLLLTNKYKKNNLWEYI